MHCKFAGKHRPLKYFGSAINHTRASLAMKADVVTMTVTEHDWEGDVCRQ